jgi:hypothetical protein
MFGLRWVEKSNEVTEAFTRRLPDLSPIPQIEGLPGEERAQSRFGFLEVNRRFGAFFRA